MTITVITGNSQNGINNKDNNGENNHSKNNNSSSKIPNNNSDSQVITIIYIYIYICLQMYIVEARNVFFSRTPSRDQCSGSHLGVFTSQENRAAPSSSPLRRRRNSRQVACQKSKIARLGTLTHVAIRTIHIYIYICHPACCTYVDVYVYIYISMYIYIYH